MRRGMSIRLRLTLLYSVILALTLIAFGSILYVTQWRATFDSIKSDLVRQAGFLADGGSRPGPPEGPPEPAPEPSGAPPETDQPGSLPGRWTQTLSMDGTITAQTADLSDTSLPLSIEGLQAVQGGRDWFETAQVDDEPLLIYTRPYTTQAGAAAIVQVAFPISQSLHSLNTLRLILVIGSSLVFLAAFAIGWVLAGTALGPIHRITSTAQAIGAERNFSRRVEHQGPADEVGQLAVTFNEMLAELESGYRQLESALRSQRRFVADASHELRTPLTTVRGNIELLRREPPIEPAEQLEILGDTTDEVERLIRLVNQLLVLARADAGLDLRREPVALSPLLEDVCRQSKLIAPRSRVLCEFPPEEIAVLGDRDALKQVLLILIDNATVHTAPGTVIRVSAAAVDGSVSLHVRDAGAGIAPDVLPHIFERFYRGDSSRSGTGVGLGLAIARELVERQDGTISVESEPGHGSVFTVTLHCPSG
jgi:two-component system, OmpR family, sensor kinase